MTFDELFALSPAAGHEADAARWMAPGAPPTDEPRLFGGVLIAQAIVAASHGTKACHALHAFFVGVGETPTPFEVAVERTRDGRSFATRRVEIRQDGRLLLAGHTSHSDGDDGPDHQFAMPDLPPPETLEDQRATRTRNAEARGGKTRRYLAEEMLDFRPIELPPGAPGSSGPVRAIWFRPRTPIEGGPAMHRAAIGFASDLALVHAGLLAHRRAGGGQLQAASLDHSLWFHREASANDWMLHVQRSPSAARGRGLARAEIYSRDGTLVASVAQEFLARYVRGA